MLLHSRLMLTYLRCSYLATVTPDDIDVAFGLKQYERSNLSNKLKLHSAQLKAFYKNDQEVHQNKADQRLFRLLGQKDIEDWLCRHHFPVPLSECLICFGVCLLTRMPQHFRLSSDANDGRCFDRHATPNVKGDG